MRTQVAMPSRWHSAKSPSERDRLIDEAFTLYPANVKRAAKWLGVNRQYLYELVRKRLANVGRVATTDPVGSVGATDTVGIDALSAEVMTSQRFALTADTPHPTFPNVSTTSVATTDEEPEQTTINLPKKWLHWVEAEALRRKHVEGGRMSKGRVIVEALELLRERLAESETHR
jgi:hypothetical protein